MASQPTGYLQPSPGRPDLSRSSSNASSRSAQSVRSTGSAQRSPRQSGTENQSATTPFRIAQSRPADQRPSGRRTNPGPPEGLAAPTPRIMDRESPPQQQRRLQQPQQQQQTLAAGPTCCGQCRACLAFCSCNRCIDEPGHCLRAGTIAAGFCGAVAGVCIALHGLP
jgi:hypothetical protein